MLQLHHYPGTASMVPHILLEELGVPYQRVLVDRANDEHKSPDYLSLNPNGLIPVLTDGDLVLYETAAICLHLCDTHAEAALAPPVGGVARAHFYKWLIWLTNTLQSSLILYFYPERWVNTGNTEGVDQVRSHAQARVGALLDQLDAALADSGGPWFSGATYTALDPYAFTLCRWTRGFEGRASAPARMRPQLGSYLQRMLARPAVQRALANEDLKPPFV